MKLKKPQSLFLLLMMYFPDPSRPCASPQKIDKLFQDFSKGFYFTLYYMNPIINPSKKDYKSYYIQDENYVIFGQTTGIQKFVYFTDYTINTDYSIWPFKDIRKDAGVFVETLGINHPYPTVKGGSYANIYLAKSANSITYTRQVQKISSVFSFIGGMVSAASALLFFIKAYTSFAFQISVAFSVFQPGKDEQKEAKPSINFITFVKLYIYTICDKLGLKLDWESMRYLTECQAEIGKQLDIKSIVKRFVFIEYCLTNIYQDYQLDGLQLNTPTSVKSIKSIREKCVSVLDEEAGSQQQEQKNNQMNGNNIVFQPPQASSSNFQIRKHSFRRFPKQSNLMIAEPKNRASIQSIRKQSNKNTIFSSNAIKDVYKKDQIRKKNIHILSIRSKDGDQISKRIWDSLQSQIKEAFDLNENIQVNRINSNRNLDLAFNEM